MKSLLFALLAPLLALAALAAPAPAQLQQASGTLYVRTDGDDLRAAVQVAIDPTWHLYHTELGGEIDEFGDGYPAKPLVVEPRGEGVEWSEPVLPEPERYDDEALDNWAWVHHGTITIWLRGRITGELGDVEVALDGLTCTSIDGRCVPYAETLEPAGRGPDALFASFPADLQVGGDGSNGGAAPVGEAERFVEGGFPPVTEFEEDESFDNQGEVVLWTRTDGRDVRAVIQISIRPAWHLYHTEKGDPDYPGMPLALEMLGGGARWSEFVLPEPERYDDEALGGWAWVHHGTIRIFVRGLLAPGVDDASHVGAKVNGQTCTSVDGTCILFAATVATSGVGPDEAFAGFPADLEVPSGAGGAGGGAGGGASGAASGGTSTGAGGAASGGPSGVVTGDAPPETAPAWDAYTFDDYAPRDVEQERGIGMWLLLAFIAGMILNVMPCVLPVVSIKILSFVQQAGESRSRILALGLAFAGGILVVFLALAALAAFAGTGWGEQFQSPAFLVVMIGIVFAFSLSMFDVFELGVPSKVQELAGHGGREGLGDAFFKGMMATVLATPCSGPFLGSTLAWALAQPRLTIFLVFTMIGLGMATPYVILTANPAALRLVPKPGPWMQTFKHAMGFVLLATVIYLMISLNQELLLFVVAFLVFVAMGCWYWGRFAQFDQSTAKRLTTLVVAFAIVGLGARIAFVDFRGMFEVAEGHLVWHEFDPEQIERWHGEGRHVFVDFTADWCPNCKVNERFVFESDEVRAAMAAKGVIAVKADITRNSPRTEAIKRLQDRLGSRSIPFLAVFPADDPYRPIVRRDIVTVGEMVSVFDSLSKPEKLGQRQK